MGATCSQQGRRGYGSRVASPCTFGGTPALSHGGTSKGPRTRFVALREGSKAPFLCDPGRLLANLLHPRPRVAGDLGGARSPRPIGRSMVLAKLAF
ncbi:hypothetical protein GW17_00000546 [Ensete ventricosum]|nr:hypothetical protein GW17_00000546 [Ensete ventricosum]